MHQSGNKTLIIAAMEAGDKPPSYSPLIPGFRHHSEDPGQAHPFTHGKGASGDAGNAGGHERAEPRDSALAEHAGQGAKEQGEWGQFGLGCVSRSVQIGISVFC